MKITNLVLLASISAMGFTHVGAQSADDIINKWIKALGGRDKLNSIRTVYIEDEISMMNNPYPAKTYLVNGKKLKEEAELNGTKMVDYYTIDSAWTNHSGEGVTDTFTNMEAMHAKVGQLLLDAAGPLYDYAAKGSKVDLLGKGTVNGAASYNLKLTTGTGVEMNIFIDSATSYILKEVIKLHADGQDMELTKVTSGYRKTGEGFVMPFLEEWTFPDATITLTHKKIEINKEIDPAIFEKPKN